MNTLRYYPVIDEKPQTATLRQEVAEAIKQNLTITDDINQATAILAAGGDGFMLDTIKQYADHADKVFVGMNFGTLGFMLNNIHSLDQLPKRLDQLTVITEKMPHVQAFADDKQLLDTYVVNDVLVGNSMMDYFHFTIQIKDETIVCQGTGLILSTPIGSTAYWLSNGGPVMPLQSGLFGIMGIAARPFDKTIIESQDIDITIKGKSSCDVGVDGYGNGYAKNINRVRIQPNAREVKIGFLPTENFAGKRLLIAKDKF